MKTLFTEEERAALRAVLTESRSGWWIAKGDPQRVMIGPYETEELAALHSVAMSKPKTRYTRGDLEVYYYEDTEIGNIEDDPEGVELQSVRFVKPSPRTIKIHPEWKRQVAEFNKSYPGTFDPSKREDVFLWFAHAALVAIKHRLASASNDEIRKEMRKWR